MSKDQKFGITKNFAKRFLRGIVKSVPLLGKELLDEIIFGTLDDEAAQAESKKVHARFDEILKQHEDREVDLVEILAGVHSQTDFNEQVLEKFAEMERLLREPDKYEVPDYFSAAIDKVLSQNKEVAEAVFDGLERLGEGQTGLSDDLKDIRQMIELLGVRLDGLAEGAEDSQEDELEISININGKYRPFSAKAMNEIISIFSKEMGGEVGDIRVLYTMPGRSMRIAMAVPREYAERVRSLCMETSLTLKKLGVKSVEVRSLTSVVKVAFPKYWPTPETFVGRERELASLDEAWENGCNVFMLVAWGGVGKTAIVNEWLNQMEEGNFRGARRVYGWSFYSQGTREDRQASSDEFILYALKWFGDEEMAISNKTGHEKALRLADLIRQERTLLVLDGLEPLQYPPGPMGGKLKDEAVAVLLRNLAKSNNGLCIVTTREEVKDIEGSVGHVVKRVDLENLSREAGAGVLRSNGVKGTDQELENTSKEFGGHALALTLLGNYLSVVHGGEIRKRDLVPHLTEDEGKGGHARRVMASYENWLKGRAELDILYLMGLFDRPAEIGAIEALRAKPVIKGLTENLIVLSDTKWKYAIHHLQELRLWNQVAPMSWIVILWFVSISGRS